MQQILVRESIGVQSKREEIGDASLPFQGLALGCATRFLTWDLLQTLYIELFEICDLRCFKPMKNQDFVSG